MQIPEIRYARNGGVSIAYQAFGQGEQVLVGLPPIVSNIEVIWEEPRAARYLSRLASQFRVVHFDKRGQGLSDRDTGVPTIDERMGDLAAVMDAEGLEKVALGGISEGGSTAALFAATYPERVSKLILWGAPMRVRRAPDFPLPPEDPFLDAVFQQWADHWATPDTLSLSLVAPSRRGDEAFLRWVNHYERQCTSPGGLLAAYQWIREIDVRSVLPTISCPTLVMRRRDDPLVADYQAKTAAELIPHARLVELPGTDHLPWSGDIDSVLDLVIEFLTGTAGASARNDRVLATVLFTDIVGSTERAASLGDRDWRELLERHDSLVAEEVRRHTGRLIKSTGDGALATFDGPAKGIQCATSLRDTLAAARIPIRAGVHTGEIELFGDDVGGIAVHIAARVEAKATASEVLVTRTVKDLVAGSSMHFEPRGTHTLKGVPDEWQLYAVTTT